MTPAEKIAAEIDRLAAPMTGFLQRLVQSPSLPGEEQEAQHLFAAKLRELGCAVEILKSERSELQDHPAFSDDGVSFDERLNVVGVWTGSSSPAEAKGRSLILNGHMDVVPVGDLALWRYPPWEAVVEGGRLHGRGACDMKAGLAAAVFAVEALRNLRFEPGGPVLLESVIGEESGGVGTRHPGRWCGADGADTPTFLPGPCRGAQLSYHGQRAGHPCQHEALRRERGGGVPEGLRSGAGARP